MRSDLNLRPRRAARDWALNRIFCEDRRSQYARQNWRAKVLQSYFLPLSLHPLSWQRIEQRSRRKLRKLPASNGYLSRAMWVSPVTPETDYKSLYEKVEAKGDIEIAKDLRKSLDDWKNFSALLKKLARKEQASLADLYQRWRSVEESTLQSL